MPYRDHIIYIRPLGKVAPPTVLKADLSCECASKILNVDQVTWSTIKKVCLEQGTQGSMSWLDFIVTMYPSGVSRVNQWIPCLVKYS